MRAARRRCSAGRATRRSRSCATISRAKPTPQSRRRSPRRSRCAGRSTRLTFTSASGTSRARRARTSKATSWRRHLARGDLGESFFFKKPVAELIGDRLEPTLALATTTMILAILIAVPLGVLAAWKRGTWIDRVVMGFSVLGFSVPVFVIGYSLIYLFAIELAGLPVQGYQRLADGVGGFLARLFLPSVTPAGVFVALIAPT